MAYSRQSSGWCQTLFFRIHFSRATTRQIALRAVGRHRCASVVEVVVNIFRCGFDGELIQQIARFTVGKGGVSHDLQCPVHTGERTQPVQVGEREVIVDNQPTYHRGEGAQPVQVGKGGVFVD